MSDTTQPDSPLGSTLDEARAKRRENPAYREAELRITEPQNDLLLRIRALQRYDAEIGYGCSDDSCCGPPYAICTEVEDGAYVKLEDVEAVLSGE